MSDQETAKVHWSFWLIAVFALMWNALGSVNFVMQMNSEMIEGYREAERAIIVGRPVWATAGFALGVFGGALGGLLLLFKKAIAHQVFVASLIGIVVTMIHTTLVAVGPAEFGLAGIFIMIILPMLVAAFLIWYARYSIGKRWLT